MENQNRFVRIPIDEYNQLRDFREYIDSGLTVEVGDKRNEVWFITRKPYVKIYTTEAAIKELMQKLNDEKEEHTQKLYDLTKINIAAQKNESAYFSKLSIWGFIKWKFKINRSKDRK